MMVVVIVYKGALAYYKIVQEKDHVYSAYLDKYKGPGDLPSVLTLVKSFRHWTGSLEDNELLFELGKAIERRQESTSLFPPRNNDGEVMDNLV